MSGPDNGWRKPTIEDDVKWVAECYEGKPFEVLEGAERLLRLMSRRYKELEPLRDDFKQAMDRYRSGEARELGEAFQLPGWRKHKKYDAHRFKVENGLKIYREVKRLLDAGGSTPGVFEEVAENYPRGPSSIRGIYYAAKKIIEEPSTATMTVDVPDD